ncbi:MAG: hypothetical protein ACRDT1_06540 [Micromonosporaceae bacterium]
MEESGLDYTILRPAWLTDHDEVSWSDRHPYRTHGAAVILLRAAASVSSESAAAAAAPSFRPVDPVRVLDLPVEPATRPVSRCDLL